MSGAFRASSFLMIALDILVHSNIRAGAVSAEI